MNNNQQSEEVKEWHSQQLFLLRSWAEICASYRWLHYRTHIRYKIKNLGYMIPIIIMSTITGTANFAQSQVPKMFASYMPLLIGTVNLFCAILTTIYQFVKVSELMESHRISSISYGKLGRNISVELNLPNKYRTTNGVEFVKECKAELDRLIEQSPIIPCNILKLYEKKFKEENFAKPEITDVREVIIFEDIDSKRAKILNSVVEKFKDTLKNKKKQKNLSETVKSILTSPYKLIQSSFSTQGISKVKKNNNNIKNNNIKNNITPKEYDKSTDLIELPDSVESMESIEIDNYYESNESNNSYDSYDSGNSTDSENPFELTNEQLNQKIKEIEVISKVT